jgi:hypothetical protein
MLYGIAYVAFNEAAIGPVALPFLVVERVGVVVVGFQGRSCDAMDGRYEQLLCVRDKYTVSMNLWFARQETLQGVLFEMDVTVHE